MTIRPPEREAKKVKIVVDTNPVETGFEKWAKPGHFSRTLAKGPTTTTWILIAKQPILRKFRAKSLVLTSAN
jgi:hypothetical protein